MTLADNILAGTRKAFHRVWLAGILIKPFNPTTAAGVPGVTDAVVRSSLDQPAPVCTIETNRGADWIMAGAKAELELGFGGLNRRVFTGTVQDRSRPAIARGRFECGGELWKLMRAKFDDARDVGGLTVAQAIAAVFAAVDINNYDLTAVPAYTLAVDAHLAAGGGMRQLEALMAIDGLRVRETGSGQVIVARYEGQPSASAFRTYTTDGTNKRILEGGVTENTGWYLTQVTVEGAWQADGTALSVTVELADKSLAQPPLAAGENISDTFQIALIWDAAKLLEAATRIAGEHGRKPQTFRMAIPLDPQIEIGTTLNISALEWGVSGNWLVWAVEHGMASDRTVVQLIGGPQYGGTINVAPMAAFTFKAENQPLGAQRYTFLTLDAAGSYQPDNASEVLTFDWAGDQDAADSPDIDSQTAAKFTVRLDPTAMSGDVLTVTLIVTNAAGLTATVKHEINITPEGTDAIVVAIAAALKTRFAFSFDGGEHWNFQTGTDITRCAQPPSAAQLPGYAVFGRENGQIYRTTDGCATAPTSVKAANSIAIADIQWDWRDPAKVWALDVQANLYLSDDDGATWALAADFRTELPLSTASGEKLGLPGGGGTWIFGGTGVVNNGRPLIARLDADNVVRGIASIYGGELETDLGAGNTNLAIVEAVDMGDGGGLLIILKNYDASDSGVRPIYLTTSPFEPANWKRATGLTAGLTAAGRIVLPGNSGPGHFHALFANRDVWHIDATGAGNVPVCTQQANVLDVGFTPNKGLWMGSEAEGLATADCHLLAIEDAAGNGTIIKSFDDLVTVAAVLPGMTAWPVVGAQGKDVAIGAPGQLSTAAKIILAGLLGSPTERFIAWREGQGNFEAHIFPTNLDAFDFFRVRAISSQVWFGLFFEAQLLLTLTDTGAAVRTKDGGATWEDPYPTPTDGGLTRVWQDIQRAADGRLWGVTMETANANHMEIWYNDDPDGDGAWTESKDSDSGADAGERYVQVLCHPTNASRIAILGYEGISPFNSKISVWLTVNRGSTWVNNIPAVKQANGATGLQAGAMMLANNRLVTTAWAVTTNKATVFTSDDNALTWVARKTFDDSLSTGVDWIYGPVGDPVGGVLFVAVEDKPGDPFEWELWRSNDGGQTWTEIASIAKGNLPPRPSTLQLWQGGIAYDKLEDAIYVFGAGESRTDNLYHVAKATGVSFADPVLWENVSDTLVPVGAHSTYTISDETTHGSAVIPS